MSSFDKLVDHLPSLWRPQPGDATLLAQWLAAVGAVLDGGVADIQHVLRAHWFDTADAAAWARHFDAERRERGLGALRPGHSGDRREALRYPYVRDLARIGALLELPPWRDPASLREGVEEYRQRIGDVLDAYREGLVTPQALRRLVDAALPEDMSADPAGQRGRFAIEEPVALMRQTLALTAAPAVQEGDRVAPLSRWALAGTGTPTFVIGGEAAAADPRLGAATAQPMVERYTPQGAVKGIGVAFTGTLAPGQALRLAPSRRHWLLRGGDLLASSAETAAAAARDPSANGPYAVAGSVPAGTAAAVAAAPDGALWLLRQGGPSGGVVRFDGTAMQTVDDGAPAGPLHALAISGASAWLGAATGLFRAPLWPAAGPPIWSAVAGVAGAVRALYASADGGVVAVGAAGLVQVATDGSVAARRHAGLDLHAWLPLGESGGRECLATARALFIAHGGSAWRYDATGTSEALPDWLEDPAPANAAASPLPAITRLARTPDGSLWLGSAAGLARWFPDRDGSTRLAAFPDVVAGAVHGLAVDERGMLWVAAQEGLFRFDGRDLAQYDFSAARWLPLGDADLVFPDALRSEPRGFWRFERLSGRWQRFDARAARFADSNLPPRAAPSEAIAGCLMAGAVRAEFGTFDGSTFTATGDVPAAQIVGRIKPDETRCLTSAMPYLPPNIPQDASVSWRYLQRADAPVPPAAGRPWWSTEGQLFVPPERSAAVPGHWRDDPVFLADAQREGQFDHAAFSYPPSARLWVTQTLSPAVGIRVRLFAADPARPLDPAIAARVWQLVARARPAGVPLQLMAEGTVIQESEP